MVDNIENNSTETALKDKEFEEFSDFSESEACRDVIEEESKNDNDIDLDNKNVVFEDITDLDRDISRSVTIVDDFENNMIIERGSASTEGIESIDLEILAAEIDSLTQITSDKENIDLHSKASIDEDPGEFNNNNDYMDFDQKEEIDNNIPKNDILSREIPSDDIPEEDLLITLSTDELENILEDVEPDETQIPEDIIDDTHNEKEEKKIELPITEEVLEEIIDEQKEEEEILSLDEEEVQIEVVSKEEKKGEDDFQITSIEKNETFFVVEIPGIVADRLPEDFNIDELGKVDLKEAERIANEDILFSDEEDIVGELHELDLMPVESDSGKEEEKNNCIDIKIEKKDIDDQNIEGEAVTVKLEEKAAIVQEITRSNVPEAESEKIEITQEKITKKVNEETVVEHKEHKEEKEISHGLKKNNDKVLLDESPKDISYKEPANRLDESNIVNDNQEHKTDLLEKEVNNRKVEKLPIAEDLPPELLNMDKTEENLYIIDDEIITKDSGADEPIFEHDELEIIGAGVVEIIEGEAVILNEADISEYQSEVTGIIDDSSLTFDDLFIDSGDKSKFIDEELDFINNSFLGKYKSEDQKEREDYTISDEKDSPPSSEFIGLISDEIDLIEHDIFQKEYQGINLDKKIDLFMPGPGQSAGDNIAVKNYNYILPVDGSFLEDEKRSIEEDLLSPSALIVEEDVEEIKRNFESLKMDKKRDDIIDITNDITVIEDAIESYDIYDHKNEGKKRDVKRLLEYLNGLLDELPDNIIKKFADSEYFDLYLEVINDSDVK